ncbi:hypothetical protein ACJZ2D_011022 [Fusarium nematophilum]
MLPHEYERTMVATEAPATLTGREVLGIRPPGYGSTKEMNSNPCDATEAIDRSTELPIPNTHPRSLRACMLQGSLGGEIRTGKNKVEMEGVDLDNSHRGNTDSSPGSALWDTNFCSPGAPPETDSNIQSTLALPIWGAPLDTVVLELSRIKTASGVPSKLDEPVMGGWNRCRETSKEMLFFIATSYA